MNVYNTTLFYAIVVTFGGIWRHVVTGNSPQAIWFCAACGAIAVFGAWLRLHKSRAATWLGNGLILLSLILCLGWFIDRFFTHPTDGKSLRVLMILAVSLIEAAVFAGALRTGLRNKG